VKYVLYFHISTFRSLCAVPTTAVLCVSLISCFPDLLLRFCLSDFEMVSLGTLVTVIIIALTFHMRLISILRSLFFSLLSFFLDHIYILRLFLLFLLLLLLLLLLLIIIIIIQVQTLRKSF